MKGIVTLPPKGGVWLKELAEAPKGEVKLRTLKTGICGTDKEIVAGKLAFARPEFAQELVIGHEALATVEDPGENTGFREGDLVVPMVRRGGKCKMCRLGRQDYCEDGDFVEAGIRGKDGFMREEFQDSPKYLVKVDDRDIMDLAVLTEPLKNVMKMLEIFNFQNSKLPLYCDDSTLNCKNLYVFGTGTEGLLISSAFRRTGVNVIAVNRHPLDETVLSFLEVNGIEYLDTSKESLEQKAGKNRMDYAIDAVGSMDVLREITKNIGNNGQIILFGTSGQKEATSEEFITPLVDKNVMLSGSTDGAKKHYEQAIQFIENYGRKYGLGKLITGLYRPEDLKIFNTKEEGEIKKVIDWT